MSGPRDASGDDGRGRGRRSRELALRTAAVTLGVVVPLALVEGISLALVTWDKHLHRPELPEAVRAAVDGAEHRVPVVPDPYLMFRMKPDVEAPTYRTNAWGLRERPVAPTPAPDVFRVLLLGGSVAWGYEATSNDETLARDLERELAARADAVDALRGRRIEVLNGGVPGYVAWQEALLYAIHLRKLAPHQVVTLDGTNEVAAVLHSREVGVPMRYAYAKQAYLGKPISPARALWIWIATGVHELQVGKLVKRLRPPSVEDLALPAPAEIGAGLRGAAAHLADAARVEGAGVLTVLQPMTALPDTKPLTPFERKIVAYEERRMPGVNRYYAESFEAMRRELAALARERRDGYAWLDATRAFASTREITFTDDCHLTPLGRRLLARHIATGLVRALARTPAGDDG